MKTMHPDFNFVPDSNMTAARAGGRNLTARAADDFVSSYIFTLPSLNYYCANIEYIHQDGRICFPVPGQSWLPCNYNTIQDGINYLNGLDSTLFLPGAACGRISCSYNAAIWWCNSVQIPQISPLRNETNGLTSLQSTLAHGELASWLGADASDM